MKFVTIQFPFPIYWRLSGNETVTDKLKSLEDWAILTPFYDCSKDTGIINHSSKFEDGTYLFPSKTLTITNDNLTESDDVDVDNIGKIIEKYLNSLRVISGQSRLPKEPLCFGYFDGNLDFSKMPKHNLLSTYAIVKNHIKQSAIKWEQLALANEAVINDSIEIHNIVLNDAAEAFLQSNFKTCILFSAIAVEACAGRVLNSEYEKILNLKSKSTIHRIIDIKVNNKEIKTKDPIFELLLKSSSDNGSKFLTLLHECPLYLLNKSLQYENNGLFIKAHSLYKTRNHLVHTGTTDIDKKDLITADYFGALESLNIANNIFKWFGERGIFIPDNKMVKANTEGK